MAMVDKNALRKVIASTTEENKYLRGDRSHHSTAYLVGWATASFRMETGRICTDAERAILQAAMELFTESGPKES